MRKKHNRLLLVFLCFLSFKKKSQLKSQAHQSCDKISSFRKAPATSDFTREQFQGYMDETGAITGVPVNQEPSIIGGTGENPDGGVNDMKKSPPKNSVATRCYVNMAMEFFHQKVFPLLSDEHIKILSETPFLHLFAFPRGISISRPILQNILLYWNKNEDCFKFKGKALEFTPELVLLVMGLQFNGLEVIYKRQYVILKSDIRKEYFGAKGVISRADLEESILGCINKGCPASHVVSLLVMYLFTMILFPQERRTVPVRLFHYADKLDRLSTYSWGKAVYGMLRDNIPKCAAMYQEMERVGGLDVEDTIDGLTVSQEGEGTSVESGKRKKLKAVANKACCLPGCTIALLAWFFEHTKFKKFEVMTERVPRFRNWKFDGNIKRKWLEQEFNNIPVEIIISEALKPTTTEKLILETGFQASIHVSSLVNQDNEFDKLPCQTLALLRQMVPVYLKFKFPVSDFLKSQDTPDRLKELDYSLKRQAEKSLSEEDDDSEI